jgi:hypothetical protein
MASSGETGFLETRASDIKDGNRARIRNIRIEIAWAYEGKELGIGRRDFVMVRSNYIERCLSISIEFRHASQLQKKDSFCNQKENLSALEG